MSDPLGDVAALPGIDVAVTDSREAVDRLRNHQVMRQRSADVSAESGLRGARASTVLEGADVSLARVREGAPDSPLARGAVRAFGELGSLASTWQRAPMQVLARLHTLIAAGATSDERLGRPRADEQAVDPLGLGDAPPPREMSPRLEALAALLTRETAAPALVVAAVTHGELLALRPFGVADGMVARTAERLTLIACGLDPKSVAAPEVGHLESYGEYARAAREYARGEPSGVATWVRHCGEAVSLGARDSTAICEALLRTRGR